MGKKGKDMEMEMGVGWERSQEFLLKTQRNLESMLDHDHYLPVYVSFVKYCNSFLTFPGSTLNSQLILNRGRVIF